jgi:transcriptional antiterminator NusG
MTNNDVYWYVLFSRTGAEEKLVDILREITADRGCFPFVPKKTCVFRRQGQKSFFQKVCFPGYVFIESDKSAEDFISSFFPVVHKINHAYRFLSYGQRYDIAMREDERIALCSLLGKNHCMDISIGFKEGDSIRIVSGALAGSESRILRINKNRKEAIVSIEMFGSKVEVSVGLDIILNTEVRKPDAITKEILCFNPVGLR